MILGTLVHYSLCPENYPKSLEKKSAEIPEHFSKRE
jgi:hypothetical protein